ncbi:MAG: small multi-drug export protein [Phycisphaerales bacterium]|nr:MAG: small multi-drug export protein [Phycisphaerales bacterium]
MRDASEEQAKRPRMTLLAGPEGRLLLIAVALSFVYTLWLTFRALTAPAESQILIGMTATTLLFGRAAGLAYGYSVALGHAKVILVAMVVETLHVLVFYPLFVFGWRHLLVIKSLKNIFERIHQAAETHKAKIQRYGIVGLFAFVWFPFWMTGPVVGSVIGFLLGLPVWLNMTAVLAGTYAAIIGWAYFLRELHERVAAYDPYAAMALVMSLIVVVLVGHLLRRTHHETKHKP